MELRYYVSGYETSAWDDRWDCYNTYTIKSPPVLQYKNTEGEWVTVPTVEEITKELT